MSNHISNYNEVKKYIAKACKLKSAARKFKREVPKLIGKYVPMLNKFKIKDYVINSITRPFHANELPKTNCELMF